MDKILKHAHVMSIVTVLRPNVNIAVEKVLPKYYLKYQRAFKHPLKCHFSLVPPSWWSHCMPIITFKICFLSTLFGITLLMYVSSNYETICLFIHQHILDNSNNELKLCSTTCTPPCYRNPFSLAAEKKQWVTWHRGMTSTIHMLKNG